jgi:hypothetical protein
LVLARLLQCIRSILQRSGPIDLDMQPSCRNNVLAIAPVQVGWPAVSGSMVTRAEAGVPASFTIQLDVGGEGRIVESGLTTGFEEAINVNDVTMTTV